MRVRGEGEGEGAGWGEQSDTEKEMEPCQLGAWALPCVGPTDEVVGYGMGRAAPRIGSLGRVARGAATRGLWDVEARGGGRTHVTRLAR